MLEFVMNRTILVILFALLFTISAAAQGKSSDAIKKQIHDLKSDRIFKLTYDYESDSTKLFAVAENFDKKDAEHAGTQAINFAMAFTFGGQTLTAPPATINLTFWVLTKKPQFAVSHHLKVTSGLETVDFGDARYAAKPSENMEYLNFVISREDLAKIVVSGTKLKLGNADLIFTAPQTNVFANMLRLSTLQ